MDSYDHRLTIAFTDVGSLEELLGALLVFGFKLLLAPSGALVVIMVYYIHTYIHVRTYIQPSFSIFSNSSDSKVKVKVKGPNMCYIFEKHEIQGYRI